jgi:hypothetical protein
MSKAPRGPVANRMLSRRRHASPRQARILTPVMEGLESRIVLSTITWNSADHPTGGDWDTASNWVGNLFRERAMMP